jgi:hypothetical protein
MGQLSVASCQSWCAAVVIFCAMRNVVAGAEQGRGIAQTVPVMQVIPLPKDEISFQRNGVELTRYYFGHDLNRPFLFPIIGPAGRSLTRMGHPHDPETHRHHNSVWISHRDVNGLNFWEDRGKVRIVHKKIERFDDGKDSASVSTINAWMNERGEVLLNEKRTITARNLTGDEWMLIIDLRFEPEKETVTFGKTPFGLIGVRIAKTIGVNDGGGTIRNSEGGVDEAGCFWKPALWVDYSGPITSKAIEGITLMDHPQNPGHPSVYHVRNDGWMGVSLTFNGPRSIEPKAPLRLRYGLYVHARAPSPKQIEQKWKLFSELPPIVEAPPKKQ